MFVDVLGVVAPFFFILIGGYAYASYAPVNLKDANILNLRLFTPMLIFSALTSQSIVFSQAAILMVGGLVVVMGSGLLAWPVARWCNLPQGPFTASMMFTNCGNMGLPLALLAFGEKGFQLAVLLFVVENFLHFTFGRAMFSGEWKLQKIVRDPNVLASVVALAVNYWQIPLPASVDFSIDLLGQICIPLMIFSLGVKLREADFSYWKTGCLGAIVCPLSGLILALVFIVVVPMQQQYQQSLLLFATLPPAAINLLMAERYSNHPQQTASLVFVGNIASLVVVPLILLLMELIYS